jgi:exo-beta-1,3-glucanase (GH17 family)
MKRIVLTIICGAVLCIFASPALGFVGIGYSPYHYDGQNPNKGSPTIPDSQFIADLQTIAAKFTVIRTYGDDTEHRLDRIVPLALANKPSLKVWLGVYEDTSYNSNADKTYLDTAISQANTYNNVDVVVVGNECLVGDPGGTLSTDQVNADLQYVRRRITRAGVKITTCLTYGAGADGRGQALKGNCDVIMINVYPFYGGVDVPNNAAIMNLINAYKNIFIPKYPGKTIAFGETGCPSAGPANFNPDSGLTAHPSLANEATYTKQVIANGPNLGDTFIYNAFDEPWNPGDQRWGKYWGIWYGDRTPKFSLAPGAVRRNTDPGLLPLLLQ